MSEGGKVWGEGVALHHQDGERKKKEVGVKRRSGILDHNLVIMTKNASSYFGSVSLRFSVNNELCLLQS